MPATAGTICFDSSKGSLVGETVYDTGVQRAAPAGMAIADVPSVTPPANLRTSPPDIPSLSEGELFRHAERLRTRNAIEHVGQLLSTRAIEPSEVALSPLLPAPTTVSSYLPDALRQGSLEAMFLLETAIARLLGMDHAAAGLGGPPEPQFAAMAVVRAFHESHGSHRKVVLVPTVASPSVAAACRRAGYRPIAIGVGQDARVTVEEIERAIDAHGRDIAALALASPNALGLFHADLVEISELVHGIGAQMYHDGTYAAALLGNARPRDFGFDLAHLEGSSLGIPRDLPFSALAVRNHLAPYLPGPRVTASSDGFRVGNHAESIGQLALDADPSTPHWLALAWLATNGLDGVRLQARRRAVAALYLGRRLRERLQEVSSFAVLGRIAFSECRSPGDSDSWHRALERIGIGEPVPLDGAPGGCGIALEPAPDLTLRDLDRAVDTVLRTLESIAERENVVGQRHEAVSDDPGVPPVFSVDDRRQ